MNSIRQRASMSSPGALDFAQQRQQKESVTGLSAAEARAEGPLRCYVARVKAVPFKTLEMEFYGRRREAMMNSFLRRRKGLQG